MASHAVVCLFVLIAMFFPPTLSGSSVTYDESMNLRNVLWLAPLPSGSTKAWVAPGTYPKLNCTELLFLYYFNKNVFSCGWIKLCRLNSDSMSHQLFYSNHCNMFSPNDTTKIVKTFKA